MKNDASWGDYRWAPEAQKCKECGKPVPQTKRRGDAFAGHGRLREYCDATCRQRHSRKHRR